MHESPEIKCGRQQRAAVSGGVAWMMTSARWKGAAAALSPLLIRRLSPLSGIISTSTTQQQEQVV